MQTQLSIFIRFALSQWCSGIVMGKLQFLSIFHFSSPLSTTLHYNFLFIFNLIFWYIPCSQLKYFFDIFSCFQLTYFFYVFRILGWTSILWPKIDCFYELENDCHYFEVSINFDGCLLDKLIFNGDYYITSSMVYSV